MNRKLFFQGLAILAVVSVLNAADSTGGKQETARPALSSNTPVIAIKVEDNGFKKQQRVIKPTTTWSKIKDLFM